MKAHPFGSQAVVLILLAILLTPAAAASNCFPCITVDEFGNGTIDLSNGGGGILTMPFAMVADPGPGGLGAALTYDLMNPPPGLVIGDVLLDEASGGFSDLIRFNPSDFAGYPFALVFYSNGEGGLDSFADTATPPSALYPNVIHVAEIGDATNSGAFYTPGPDDPGFIPGFNVQYTFISDGSGPPTAITEPGAVSLLIAGMLGSVAASSKRERRN